MSTKVTYQQIMSGRTNDGISGIRASMCWGAREFVSNGETLRFRVSGRLHKGYVSVTLNGNDLYDIELFTVRKKRNSSEYVKQTVSTHTDVFCEDLTRVIDTYVESNKEV